MNRKKRVRISKKLKPGFSRIRLKLPLDVLFAARHYIKNHGLKMSFNEFFVDVLRKHFIKYIDDENFRKYMKKSVKENHEVIRRLSN